MDTKKFISLLEKELTKKCALWEDGVKIQFVTFEHLAGTWRNCVAYRITRTYIGETISKKVEGSYEYVATAIYPNLKNGRFTEEINSLQYINKEVIGALNEVEAIRFIQHALSQHNLYEIPTKPITQFDEKALIAALSYPDERFVLTQDRYDLEG